MFKETCVAKLFYARWASVETSADVTGAAVASLATADFHSVTIEPANHTKLTEVRRNNMTSG